MKTAFYKNNVNVVYFSVLHRLAGKCTKIYNACKTIARLIKPLVLRHFRCRCGLCKISAVVVYKKSRCRLISVLFASILFCDLNLEVIEKFQANNYRLPHWKKTVPFCPWKFPEIRSVIFGRMVSAHRLRGAYPPESGVSR